MVRVVAAMLEVRVLGELELRRAGKPLALPASKKSRALLAFLVVTARSHRRESLCDLLWLGPDDPRAALRWSLTKIRALVDTSTTTRLVADRDHVAFDATAASIDLVVARQLVSDHAAAASAPVEALLRAEALFRGELLAGLDLPDCYRYHEWCVAEREAARALRVSILTALIDRLAGTPETALVHARTRVSIDPLSEAAHIDVIVILARLGRKREALAQYETCARILAAELGTKPSARLIHARSLVGPHGASTRPPPPQAPPPAPATTEALPGAASRPALVGRHAERAAIAERVAAAAARATPAALLFVGEPGIGKTRLLEVVAEATRGAGGRVLAGRAFEGEMVRPYGPWVDALRSIALGDAVEGLRGDLASLLPELGASGTDVDRNRLFGAVTQLLGRMAERAPLALVLDDLQWLDEASAALLHHVARNPSPGVLIAAGARAAELSDNTPVQRLVRALSRERRLVDREVPSLDEAEVRLLVQQCAGDVDSAGVFARSGGHPYFAVEIAGALERGDDVVPDSLAAMIDERLARLDPVTRNLVPWAAAMRRGFDLDRLSQASGVSPGEVLSAVGELERHRILAVGRDGGGAGYDFAHDLVRERAYRALSEPRRRLIHLQIARVLSRANALDGDTGGEVAHHASLGGDHDLAARASLAGGRHAIRVFAGEEAARLARLGAQHAAELPAAERLPLQVALLDVLTYSSAWRRRGAELEEELVGRIAECEMHGLSEVAAAGFKTLSLVQYEIGKVDRAMTSSLRALTDAGAAPRTQAENLAFAARCLTMGEGDMPRAEELLERAREVSGPEGANLLELQWAEGLFHRFAGRGAQAVASLEHALRLARQAQNRWSQFECLMTLTRIDLEDGRPAAALARCGELSEVAAKMTGGSELAIAATLEALARVRLCEEGADERLETAVSALRRLDAKGALTCVLAQWARSDLEARRLDRAKSRATEAVQAAEIVHRRSDASVGRAILGSVLLAMGERDEAIAELRAASAPGSTPLALSAYAVACAQVLAAAVESSVSTVPPTRAPTRGRKPS
jgi:DNA-binding SARP family transcriptional activator/tetratricopeptide (TPR) repeat protein